MMFFDHLEEKLASDQARCKEVLQNLKCPVHKLKARVTYDYDDNFTNAHIKKCCCPQFAKQVADALTEAEVIDVVVIGDCEYTR